MFKNVGSKVKSLALITCWVGIAACVIIGITQMMYADVLMGIIVMALGSLCSWIGSLGLYAIGEAAENSAIVANLAVKADMEREQQKKEQ